VASVIVDSVPLHPKRKKKWYNKMKAELTSNFCVISSLLYADLEILLLITYESN
jgi:hypothetical protein